MKILAIETSCDETAAAVTCERTVLSNIVATQVAEHRIYGGVVPEIASRRHAEAIVRVTDDALREAGCTVSDIDAVAVTYAPGLIGALLVGVNFAKGIALSANKPLIPVHHLRSHIAANYITDSELKPPFLCLVVSGGHSHLVEVRSYTDYRIVAKTRDDAAGECFDKCARVMGMPYPGGIELDRIAESGDSGRIKLPYPRIEGSAYDFSFSGLKTAVINLIHNAEQKGEQINRADVSAALRARVCDMLIDSTVRAALDLGYSTVALAGGVSANSELRRRMESECASRGWKFCLPELKFCGDNAAMVGVQGYYEYIDGRRADLELNAYASLPIDVKM